MFVTQVEKYNSNEYIISNKKWIYICIEGKNRIYVRNLRNTGIEKQMEEPTKVRVKE